ncbi:MAG: RluA family pseudouridine synthase [Planctomycetota bacterium]
MGNISGQHRKAKGKLMDRRFINSHWRKRLGQKIAAGEIAPEDDTAVFRDIEIAFNRPPHIVRLDAHLAARFSNLSRAFFQRLIRDGEVRVGGRRVKPSHALKQPDVITLRLPEMPERIIEPEPIPLDIIHEDADILVINKQPGIICHPGRGNQSGTLANAIINHVLRGRPNTDNVNPGIVHRLDKNTTGAMVIAKNPYAHHHICRQFMSRRVDKIYIALVAGALRKKEGLIDMPVGFHPRRRELMTCASDGIAMKEARTEYKVIEKFAGCTLVSVKLHTGRTHQIRVHFQAIGHPVIGDAAYGVPPQRAPALNRQALHAWKLTITHPATKRKRTFTAPLPEDIEQLLNSLRK